MNLIYILVNDEYFIFFISEFLFDKWFFFELVNLLKDFLKFGVVWDI